jgi:hypothetical protein
MLVVKKWGLLFEPLASLFALVWGKRRLYLSNQFEVKRTEG